MNRGVSAKPASRQRKDEHVVMHGAGIKCLHCGTVFEVRLPVLVKDLMAALAAVARNHRRCRPRPLKSKDLPKWLEPATAAELMRDDRQV